MFDTPDTVEINAATGLTTLNLGFMTEAAAAKVEAALAGKTFMDFTVCASVCPGGPYVSISTTYEETSIGILAFAMNVLASAA